MKRVDMYIETSIHGPRRDGKAGYVSEYITKKGIEVPVSEVFATKNSSEQEALLRAIAEGLKRINKGTEIVIHTNSDWIITCITKWLCEWERNEWRKADGSEVKHKELLQQIRSRQHTDMITAEKGVGLKYGLWLKTEVKR